MTRLDGRPIRSPEDARYFNDYFSEFVKRSLPRVKRVFIEAEAMGPRSGPAGAGGGEESSDR